MILRLLHTAKMSHIPKFPETIQPRECVATPAFGYHILGAESFGAALTAGLILWYSEKMQPRGIS